MMSLPATDQTPTQTERAILAGGCFWGLEDLLRRAKGVVATRVGYIGGEMPDPTYARHYGHAEAVELFAGGLLDQETSRRKPCIPSIGPQAMGSAGDPLH